MRRRHTVLLLALALTVTAVLTACGSAAGTPEWHFEQGNALFEAGLYDQAIEEYDEAIRLNPEFADAYYNRGAAYGRLGQFQLAIEDCDEAIRLDPENAFAYLLRGAVYSDMGRPIEARADLETAITLTDNPQWIETATQLIEELEE